MDFPSFLFGLDWLDRRFNAHKVMVTETRYASDAGDYGLDWMQEQDPICCLVLLIQSQVGLG